MNKRRKKPKHFQNSNGNSRSRYFRNPRSRSKKLAAYAVNHGNERGGMSNSNNNNNGGDGVIHDNDNDIDDRKIIYNSKIKMKNSSYAPPNNNNPTTTDDNNNNTRTSPANLFTSMASSTAGFYDHVRYIY